MILQICVCVSAYFIYIGGFVFKIILCFLLFFIRIFIKSLRDTTSYVSNQLSQSVTQSLHCFSILAVTNGHKLNGLSALNGLPYCSGGQQSEMGLMGLKLRCPQGCFLYQDRVCVPGSVALEEILFSCLFQLLEAARTPSPHRQSQQPQVTSFSCHIMLISFSFWANQNNSK